MQPAAVLAVIVKAQGVTQTNAQLATVQKTAEKADSKVTRLGDSMVSSGKKMQSAGRTMTVGLTLPLVGAGYLAVKTAATFERSMAQVQVAGEVGGKGMKTLERLALKMGAETVFSANDASEAMLELVKSGITPADVKAGALASTMSLAATESMELGRTAEIVGAAMNTFNLKADESQRIADALAGGAIASAASVEGLAMSLSQGGQSASMYGLSIEETVGALAAFAQNGIQASDAGTSFKTFMMRLNPVQKKQKELMEELNLTFFNQSGELVNLVQVSSRLREALSGMSQQQRNAALQTLFGSDAQRAANIVFKEGPKGLKEYIAATKERGTAEKMANAQMEGMPGAIERMKGSLETAALVAGKAMAPAIEDVAGVIEGLANAFSMLPPEMQTTVIVGLAVVAALGPMVYILGAIVKNGGYVVKAIGWVVGALSTQTAATTAATVANAEFAASLHTAAVAQQELLIANRSGTVVGSVPIASGPAATAPAAKSAATGFATSFARFLGPALALLGVGMIVSSAIQGDMKQAGFQAGGALAGGIAGFLIGGPLGAMIGGGLGAVIGGEIGKLFESEKVLHPLQEKLAAQSKASARAWTEQRKAIQGLRGAENNLAAAQRRHSGAASKASAANKHLNNVVEKYGPVSRQAHRAELALAKARRENTRAANAEKHAESMSENQKKLLLLRSRAVVAHEKARIPSLQQTIKQLTARSQKEKNNVQVLQRLVKAENQLAESSKRVRSAIQDVAAISPKQAQALRRMDSVQAEFGMHLRGLTATYKAHKIQASQSIARVGNAWIDTRGTIHTSTGNAKKDILGFTQATTEGVALTKKDLYAFASELGIRNVHFGAKQKGKAPKKQSGGMVVPGGGTGDTVPLTAFVEPGEIVHVLNMKASKDRNKLEALETLNREVPRFQVGGTLGTRRGYPGLSGDTDFYPEMGFALSKMAGHTHTHVSVTSGYRSIAEQAALYNAYKEGTGNLAAPPSPNAPHVKGFAADISPDRGTYGNVAGDFGLGFTVPSEAWHIELLNAALGAHGSFSGKVPQLPGVALTGPKGLLKDIGQKEIDEATKIAQNFLNQNAGGGVGSVAVGPVVEMAKEMVANMWGMGQWSPFNSLEMAEAGWDPKAVNPSSGAAGLAQALPPSKYPPGAWPYAGPESAMLQLKWMMGYIKERYGDPAGAWAFHQANNWYQKGGVLGNLQKGSKEKKPAPIGKQIKTALKGIAKGKQLPKYKAMLKKAGRRIDGIGLGDDRINRLSDLTKDAEKYSEYASNASSMTRSVENPSTKEEEIIQGVFKGRNEGAWLSEQLNALLALRREVTGAHGILETKHVPRVQTLLKDAKERLRHVQKVIRQAEQHKRELEKKVDEIEQAQKKNKQTLEKEIKELEHKLDQAQGAKNPNQQYIDALRSDISVRKNAISDSDNQSNKKIHDLRDDIRGVEKEQKARARVESALSGEVIPGLESKRSGMFETMSNLYGSGGEIKGASFLGLQQIQGAGGSLDEIQGIPPLGSLGGEVFTVQNRLREIQEEAERPKEAGGPSDTEQEILAMKAELAQEWKKRYIISQSQFATLSGMPTVQEATSVPFAGSFASGGVMMAEVGERGREIVAAPQGSRVIPSHEARAALSGGGAPQDFNIDELHLYPDGTAVAKIGGREFRKKVKKVNQEEASPRPTPGGKRQGWK